MYHNTTYSNYTVKFLIGYYQRTYKRNPKAGTLGSILGNILLKFAVSVFLRLYLMIKDKAASFLRQLHGISIEHGNKLAIFIGTVQLQAFNISHFHRQLQVILLVEHIE